MNKTQNIYRILLSAAFLSPSSVAVANVQMNVGGKYLPATGVVKSLVVFAQFKDDREEPQHINWPLGQLPPWSHNLFATEMAGSYPAWTVTDYYHQMSNGRYHVLGEVYPHLVVTNFTAQEYAAQGKTFGDINREILSQVDPAVDFTRYDRWSLVTMNGSLYAYEWGDGTVEMVFIIFRTVPNGPYGTSTLRRVLGYNWSALAMLGFSTPLLTSEGIFVKGMFPGSGVTVTNGLHYSLPKMVSILAHEYGHYLFEVHHFETRGGLGLMGGSGPAMNAYERARLGYVTLRDVYADQIQELDDYVTTGVAYRIPVSPNEFFIVENRQRLSIYDGLGKDGEDVKPYGKGIYIFHVHGDKVDNLDVESAAGNWDWVVDRWFANPWDLSMQLPLIVRTTPNPFGKDGFDAFVANGRSYFKDFEPHPQKDSVMYTAQSQGSERDAFNIGYNELFAPWTNPNSHRVDGSPTGIVVRLMSQEGTRIRVWFSLNGQGTVTSVKKYDNGNNSISNFELEQNFPNPFNPSTVIRYSLPEMSAVTLQVYDVLGREVAVLVDGMKQAGSHSVQWDGRHDDGRPMGSGTYVYVLQAGHQREVKRMTLLK